MCFFDVTFRHGFPDMRVGRCKQGSLLLRDRLYILNFGLAGRLA